MPRTKADSLVILETDYQRLLKLIEQNDTAAADLLDTEISRADVVPAKKLPADAVTMDSVVTFIDLGSNEEKTISLVYPADANVDEMKISILSPVGSALIGLRIGGKIDWPVQGKVRRLKVVTVVQPERHAPE
ncbi:MAG: nucleoside diphosphate kinase regulator [Cellvibrio sp.]|uniref:nucleoside diphosphate kinase regulator n=1 Tax=Cellvibrio sp. TaxID=1965322 RepID=UPI0031A67221